MPEQDTSGKKNPLSVVIKVFISVSLLGYLFYRIGLGEFLGMMGKIELSWVILSAVMLTLSNITGSVQWHLLLDNSGISMTLRRTFSYYYTGLFFNNFLLGFFGGDLFRVYDITRHSGNHSAAISTVFLDRLIGVSMMCGLAFILAFFTFDLMHIQIIILPLTTGIVILTFVACFFYFKGFAKKFEHLGERILPAAVQQKLRDVYNAVNYFRYHKLLLLRLLVISMMTQSLRILTHYCVARSLHITLSWQVYFVLIPVISLVTIIPISVGGLGVREQSGVVLFRFVGLAAPQAFTMQLMVYFINVVCSIPGGGSFIFRKHGRSE